MNGISRLEDFIKRAERNYKYKPNTASALAAAIRLFGSVLTEDEAGLDSFPIEKLDEIAERIHTKFPQKYTVDSLATYKSRMNRVTGDFAKYGADAKSMASWNPTASQRKRQSTAPAQKTTIKKVERIKDKPSEDEARPVPTAANGVQDITLPLADHRNVVIYYPLDLTEIEAEKIGHVLRGIADLTKTA